MYQWVSGAITSVGLAGCVSFVLVYHRRSGGRWYGTSEGRYLMATSVILASLFALILSFQIFGEWPGRKFVAVLLYAAYAAFPWWLFWLLLRETKRRIRGG
jgi:hypothetical protein